MKNLSAFVLGFCMLSACGGGSPYVGYWQCQADPTSGLEVARFENYYLITARQAGKDIVREGVFENKAFSVGANNVGQAMTIELRDEQLICTNPPNFCRCDSGFNRVENLMSSQDPTRRQLTPLKEASSDYNNTARSKIQILRAQEPLAFALANGGKVLLFDHYQNEDFEQRMFDWSKLTYFYLPQLVLIESPDGTYAKVQDHADDLAIKFSVALAKIDHFELMERIDV